MKKGGSTCTIKNDSAKSYKIILNPVDSTYLKLNPDYSANQIELAIQDHLEILENNGYPFAIISTESRLKGDSILLYISTEKGPQITFDSLIIKGETPLSEKIITKVLEFNSADLYSENYLTSLNDFAAQNTYFDFSKKPSVIFRENAADVIVTLKKINQSRFDGIIGIQRTEEQNTTITGNILLDLNNSFNRAERFLVNWERFNTGNQLLKLNIESPFLLKTLLKATGELDILRRDSTFNRASISGGLVYDVSPKLSLGLSIGSIQNNSGINTEANTFNTQTSFTQANFLFKSSRITSLPRKGLLATGTVGIGNRNSDLASNSQYLSFSGNLIKTTTLLPKLVTKLQVNGASVNSADLFENEVLLIGGINTLRGIDQRSLSVTSWLTSTAEIQYFFDQQSNIFLFYDANFSEANLSSSFESYQINATGLGLNVGTKSGIFTFNYGVSDFFENQFLFRNAKINFGYISTF